MKKIFLAAAAFVLASGFVFGGVKTASASGTKLPNFSDNFESYEVNGQYVESDKSLTEKWDNNVFRGGEPLGMDSHIYQRAKIDYENGSDGNKVLHINNTTGADTFFYMGPSGDYRVKNFTVSFKVKFLTEGLENKVGDDKRSWVGVSFRKKASSHYTGTNNLMFTIQRYVESTQITGQAYAVFNGGSPTDLATIGSLYGDKLTLSGGVYTVPDASANVDLPWVEYKLDVNENSYVMSVDGTVVKECVFNVDNFNYYGYLSLNCCTANVMIDDFSVEVKDETLPPEILPLEAPVLTLKTEEKKIEWDYVNGASTYVVTINGKEKTVTNNSYSLDRLSVGEHKITVRALSDDIFEAKDSLESNEIVYIVENGDGGDTNVAPSSSNGEKGGCGSSIGSSLTVSFAAFALACAAFAKANKKHN